MTSDNNEAPHDYIFGELDIPQNAAQWEKERLTGVRHYSQKTPLAPKPNETVTLKVTTDAGQAVDEVWLWFTTDEWQTIQEMSFAKTQLVWNTLAWTYIQEWAVTLPPQPEGVMLRYKIGAKVGYAESITYADNQTQAFEEATHYSIWYGGESNPDWAKQAVVYQVFVDRFNPGEGRDWIQTADICQHFGGTLVGVIEKLPAIKAMGFNTIWLTPIFDSPSHHGYDISDYFRINPRFGTLDDFKWLIADAHDHGIRIILDFVANHCSNEHPNFQDALKNEDSPYREWFVWKKWPAYDSFFNVGTMPKINLAYGSPARDYLLSAAQYWLNLGVDGYRLDYAYGPEHDFWVDFRQACVTIKPEIWTFGELIVPADIQASYADSLGGSLDFLLCQALRGTFGSESWRLSKFAGFLNSHYRYFPEGYSLPNFIDNHDMDRFYTIAGENSQKLALALMILYALPGPPIVYYGTEALLSQRHLLHDGGGLGFDEARLEMNWKREANFEFAAYLSKLAEVRSRYKMFGKGPWHIHTLDDEAQVLILATEDEHELFVINRSDLSQSLSIPLIEADGGYLDLVSDKVYPCADHKMALSIGPFSGLILSLNG